jgi:rhodanese-related sulfurtransferase
MKRSGQFAPGKSQKEVFVKQVEDASKSERSVPKGKQTSLGLYLTAEQAHEKWKANPEQVKILDVRTPDECLFVGHPNMAWNVPLVLQTYQWDASGGKLPTKPNPNFLAQVKDLLKPSDALLVMCRSGGRSAMAVNLLAEAGFKNVYNVVDAWKAIWSTIPIASTRARD